MNHRCEALDAALVKLVVNLNRGQLRTDLALTMLAELCLQQQRLLNELIPEEA